MNYEYNRGPSGSQTHRPSSQFRERGIGRARGTYDPFARNRPSVDPIYQQQDLSHIKINDLLNHKRVDYDLKSHSPLNSRDRNIYNSNSVRNLGTERSDHFFNKAQKMDEIFRKQSYINSNAQADFKDYSIMKEQIEKLQQENKDLKISMTTKDQEIFSLNEKLSNIQADLEVMKRQHAEELSKKDKIIVNLK